MWQSVVLALVLLLSGPYSGNFRVQAAARPDGAIWVTAADFDELVRVGKLQPQEARMIWTALRSRRHLEETTATGSGAASPEEATGSIGDAVRDLRSLFSFTNLLYCIATTLLTAVFSFVLFTFREMPAMQGGAALGYGAIFTQWGLRLMAQSANSALPGDAPRLVGGILLLLPNFASAVVGAVALQITGIVRPRKMEDWSRDAQWSMDNPEEMLRHPTFFVSCLTLEGCVLLSATVLYNLSGFPGLLVPLLAAIYLMVVSLCLRVSATVLTRAAGFRSRCCAASVPIFGSAAHALALWSIANSGLVSGDVCLGLMVTACNSGFWSLPLTLCSAPLILCGDDALEAAKAAKDYKSAMQAVLWPRLSFVVAFLLYSVGNIAMLSYGLRYGSWVPVPYALFGVIVTMLLTNSAPWRLRLAMRIFYNLPVAIALFAACTAYERVTDVLWLEILSWLGQPHHFQIFAIFMVRAATLLCAMWSLWFGMSRFLPHRLLQDLRDQRDALARPEMKLSEIKDRIAQLETTTSFFFRSQQSARQPVEEQASAAQSATWLSRMGGLLSHRPAPPPQAAREAVARPPASQSDGRGSQSERSAELARLRDELRELEASLPLRRQKKARVQAHIGLLEGRCAWLLGGVPLCWMGFSFLASVCDVPEPFYLLRYALNMSAVACAVLGFNGMIQSACGAKIKEASEFWRLGVDTPAWACVPTLLFFGVRAVYLADGSILRNSTGLILLSAGFVGLVDKKDIFTQLAWGAVVSTSLLACGVVGDTKVLAFAGILCLYGVLLLLLHTAMGSNVLSLVCGITGLAMITMHLASTSEAYFLTMQTVIGDEAWPWASFLQKMASREPFEMRVCQTLVRVVGGLVLAI